ncbi:hypothetical protein KAR91_63930 [Candidatus Pacearchaeota archaeon]|nr:hypothetical protein [Candidatus Pacearchaeota archaeon]
MAIGTVLSIQITEHNGVKIPEAKVQVYETDNLFLERYGPPGEDSAPLPEKDIAVTVKRGESGAEALVGYLDPINEPIALSGEWKRNGRDDDAKIVNYIYLKKDGTIIHWNEKANIEINPDGEYALTTPKGTFLIDKDGNIELENSAGSFLKLTKDTIAELMGNADFAVRYSKLETAFNQFKSDYALHDHTVSGVQSGSDTKTTSVAGPTTADISGAKIDEIKVP